MLQLNQVFADGLQKLEVLDNRCGKPSTKDDEILKVTFEYD